MEHSKLVEELGSFSTRLSLPRKQTIICQGDDDENLYFIVSGKIRISINSCNGCEKIIYILKEGNFFNEDVLFFKNSSLINAECEEATTILRINPRTLKKSMYYDEITQNIFQKISVKNNILIKELENISFKSCRERILAIFANSCDKTKLYDHTWYEVNIRYTHQDIASIIGANRVTVSKIVTDLCDCGELRNINRKIQINKKVISEEKKYENI